VKRLLLAAVALLGLCGSASAQGSDRDHLRGGWYPWDPYQYLDYSRGTPRLTGFDVEIERAIGRIMGVKITIPQLEWAEQLAGIAAGTTDFAAGATKNEARTRFAWFSKPYRTETDVLIVPRGASIGLRFRTIDGMIEAFKNRNFRLGVLSSYVYADPRINDFIADPANQGRIVPVMTDALNLQNLLAGVIDGFLADRIAASTTAWRRGQGQLIEEHPLRFSTDIYFMLSRASQTPERLARLDQAIDQLKESGEYNRIARSYIMPVLMNQTIDRDWFRLLVFVGTVAFALSGVLLAWEGRYTLMGALILAVLPAVGGGVVRDLVLQRNPIGIVRDPEALLIVFGTVVGGMAILRLLELVRARPLGKVLQSGSGLAGRSIEVCDAIGLAAFTVTGVVVVMDTAAQPLWLWGPIGAILTSSFGGLMRDLFRHDRIIANLRGELYAEISLVWGLAFAVFLQWEGERLLPEEIGLGVAVTVLGAFATRMVALARHTKGWRFA